MMRRIRDAVRGLGLDSLRAGLLALLLGLAAAAHAEGVWFADADGVHRVDPVSNTVVQSVPAAGVVALAHNLRDGSVWSLTADRAVLYDAVGTARVAVDLRTIEPSFGAARRIALDPGDDSVWIAGGNHLAHLDGQGARLATFRLPSIAQDLALAQDQTVWVLGRNQLLHYGPGGLLAAADLAGDMQQAEFLAIDDTNGSLWLAGARRVFQVAAALPLQPRLALPAPEPVQGLTLLPDTGAAWLVGPSMAFGFDRLGASLGSSDVAGRGMRNPQALVFDAPSQALWLGHEKGLTRLNASGQPLATIPASVKVAAIARAPAGIVPLVSLVSPPDGALVANPLVPIRLHLDASCFGRPCGFPPAVFAAYTVTATLNGQEIGPRFVFDPATGDTVFTPTGRHLEGVNTLGAFVTDAEGRRSRPISATFAVDSTPPRFVQVAPPDGSLFVSPAIRLTGAVDDPSARVALESFSGAEVRGPNPAGATFAFDITLRPGTNAFRLTATDLAGNASPLPLAYVFSTLTLTVTSPADGATVDTDRVTVAGSFSGADSATVTVNGLAATVAGSSFSATVPLAFGRNTITVVARSPQGAEATRTLSVTSTAPAIAIASPVQGAAIAGDQVLVRGSIQAPPNSGVSINGVVAAVDAAGNYFAVVPLQPGANSLTARVTAPSGASASRTLTVTATGVAPALVATAAPLSGMAPLTVTFTVQNPTAAGASFTFDGAGPFAVPAGGSASVNVTYPAGVFTPTLVLSDASGASFTRAFVVRVTTPEAIDALLQALWRGVVAKLASGDVEGALQDFAPGARDRYRRALNDVAPALPAMFASFPPITATAIVDGDAEYFVMVPRDGKRYGHFLYFMQDGDGVWRLQSL